VTGTDRRLHITTIVTRFQAGAGVVALRGARGLDPNRFRVSVVAGSGDHLLDEAAAAGFEVTVVPELGPTLSPTADARALRRLTALLELSRPDVVHTHSAKAGTLGRLAARSAGVPRIVHTYHGFPFHEFQSSARRAAYVAVERHVGRFTDAGLCVGVGVAAEAVRRRLIAPERITTIGVTVDESAPVCTPRRRAAARHTLGVAPDATVVGAVGRLTYQKAPEDFVAALARLARPGLVGVWIGGGELARQVEEAARRAAPRVRIVLAGERRDVPALLPAFDVFALPSRYEGLPVAVVEAMVCGIPVVATAVNAVSDVVIPGVTGLLVPPERPHLFADAIAHLLDHPGTAADMAAAGRRRLIARHSDAELADALVSAYEAAPTFPMATAIAVNHAANREERTCI
jgi:glycosyltransferase involved in cell wall biosynthesis